MAGSLLLKGPLFLGRHACVMSDQCCTESVYINEDGSESNQLFFKADVRIPGILEMVHQIPVNYCPICGYKIEKKDDKTK